MYNVRVLGRLLERRQLIQRLITQLYNTGIRRTPEIATLLLAH